MAEFHKTDDYLKTRKSIEVMADTGSIPEDHPVIVAMLERYKASSKPGKRDINDKDKIALSIEGGGMRGNI